VRVKPAVPGAGCSKVVSEFEVRPPHRGPMVAPLPIPRNAPAVKDA
jgi:hypothetical protein